MAKNHIGLHFSSYYIHYAAYNIWYFQIDIPGNFSRLPFKRQTGVRRIFSSGVYLLNKLYTYIKAVVNSDAIQEEEMNSDGWWNMASV